MLHAKVFTANAQAAFLQAPWCVRWVKQSQIHHSCAGCPQHNIDVLCDRLFHCALSASHSYITVDMATRTLDGLPDCHNQKSGPRPRLPLVKATVSRLAQNPCIGIALFSQGSKVLSWLLEVVVTGAMPKSMHAAACSITVIEFMQVCSHPACCSSNASGFSCPGKHATASNTVLLMKDLAAKVGLWLHAAQQADPAQTVRSMEYAASSLIGMKPKTEKLDQERVCHVIESLINLCKTSQDRLAIVPGLRDLVCMNWQSSAAWTLLGNVGAGTH